MYTQHRHSGISNVYNLPYLAGILFRSAIYFLNQLMNEYKIVFPTQIFDTCLSLFSVFDAFGADSYLAVQYSVRKQNTRVLVHFSEFCNLSTFIQG